VINTAVFGELLNILQLEASFFSFIFIFYSELQDTIEILLLLRVWLLDISACEKVNIQYRVPKGTQNSY